MLTHSYCEYETFNTHECHSLFRKVILAVIFLIYGKTFFIQFMFYKSLQRIENLNHQPKDHIVSYVLILFSIYFYFYLLTRDQYCMMVSEMH